MPDARHRRYAGLVLLAAVVAALTGCGDAGSGDPDAGSPGSGSPGSPTASSAPSAAEQPPFGLPAVTMPSTREQVLAIFAKFPATFAGRTRAKSASAEVRYTGGGRTEIGVEAVEAKDAFGTTPVDAGLRRIAVSENLKITHECPDDSPVVCLFAEGAPGSDEYAALWGARSGPLVFAVSADSAGVRDELVRLFVQHAS